MKNIIPIPRTLTIEGNASCQLRCPTCPTTGNGYPPVVGSGFLRYADLERLLSRSSGIKAIQFENRGELFLNPELAAILRHLHERRVAAFCDTGSNFNSVKDEVIEALVRYRFRRLVASIDGASQKTYSLYRIGGNFETVIKNIQAINALKRKFHTPYPRLTWQFIVFGHNEHEIADARRMASSLGMAFYLKMSWDSSLSPIRDEALVKAQTGWPAVTRERFAEITGAEYMRSTCYALWHSPRVNWDGKVLGCCWNSWQEFGNNAFADGYDACVNSEAISDARSALLGALPMRPGLPCTTCELYLRLTKSKNPLSLREIRRPTKWWYQAARYLYRKSGIPGGILAPVIKFAKSH